MKKVNWQTKKLGEIQAVEKFFKNNNSFFNADLIQDNPPEPADILYGDKKYQVVNADFKFQKDINVHKFSSSNRNPEETFRDFVLKPIEKKRKYGANAKGHILIIDSKLSPPDFFINQELKKRNNKEFDIGFNEIYLVTFNKNFKIFPL
ncbi:MAG: hypothetical protein V1484_02810 [bacterium]